MIPSLAEAKLCGLLLEEKGNDDSLFSLSIGDTVVLRDVKDPSVEKKFYYLGYGRNSAVDSSVVADTSEERERLHFFADTESGLITIVRHDDFEVSDQAVLNQAQPTLDIAEQTGPTCMANSLMNCVRYLDLLRKDTDAVKIKASPQLWKKAQEFLSNKSALKRLLEFKPGASGQLKDLAKLLTVEQIDFVQTGSKVDLLDHLGKGGVAMISTNTEALAAKVSEVAVVDSHVGSTLKYPYQWFDTSRSQYLKGHSGGHSVAAIGTVGKGKWIIVLDSNSNHFYLIESDKILGSRIGNIFTLFK